MIALAPVDDDPIRSAMTLQPLSEEALGCRQVALLAEPKLDCVTDSVDGAIEIHPLAADLDVGLVDMPFAGHATLAPVETLEQTRARNGRSSGGWSCDRP